MAENYVLFTDSACDIHPDKLAEWNVNMLPLAFLFALFGFFFTDGSPEHILHGLPALFRDRASSGGEGR